MGCGRDRGSGQVRLLLGSASRRAGGGVMAMDGWEESGRASQTTVIGLEVTGLSVGLGGMAGETGRAVPVSGIWDSSSSSETCWGLPSPDDGSF